MARLNSSREQEKESVTEREAELQLSLASGTILAERMLPNLDEKYQDGNRPMVMVQKEGSILNAPEFLSFLESLRFFQEVGIMPNRVPWILAEFDTSMILFLLLIVMMRDQKICCFHNRKIEAFVFSWLDSHNRDVSSSRNKLCMDSFQNVTLIGITHTKEAKTRMGLTK